MRQGMRLAKASSSPDLGNGILGVCALAHAVRVKTSLAQPIANGLTNARCKDSPPWNYEAPEAENVKAKVQDVDHAMRQTWRAVSRHM